MPFDVLVTPEFEASLSKLPVSDRSKVLQAALVELGRDPRQAPPKCKMLKKPLDGFWRLRYRHYRVIYLIDGESVVLLFAGLRRTVYKVFRFR